MQRRAYLAGFGASLAALAGCSTFDNTEQTRTPTPTGEPSGTGPPQLAETDLPVSRTELTYAGPRDLFPAIVNPAFDTDWSGIEFDMYGGPGAKPRLSDDDRVIGVRRDGDARAYPLRLLMEHEIVNDDFGGPLLVSFCHLCGSGVTAKRVIDGEPARFGVSGKLWHSNLVMYDEPTESYWSQILATAIRGEQTGTQLQLVPSTLTTWGEWRETNPETVVLRPPPESGTIDGSGPRFYASTRAAYRNSDAVGVGQNEVKDDRLRPKQVVIGVSHDGQARAYPLRTVAEHGVINDYVGDLPVVITMADTTLVAYDRRIEGVPRPFSLDSTGTLRGAGSRWDIRSGRAISGPHEGTRLKRANDISQLYWFAWTQHHPETTIYN